jgi:hypothetical protein
VGRATRSEPDAAMANGFADPEPKTVRVSLVPDGV